MSSKSSGLPSQIRSLLQPDFNSSDLILTTIPIPVPNTSLGEHLIKVYATAPCAGELLWAKYYPGLVNPSKLLVPCYDLSGVVVNAPENSPFRPGDEVYTRTHASRTGNAREYTIALTSELAHKPKSLGWGEAASIPLSAFTAFQALFEHGGLAGIEEPGSTGKNRGKKVLVTAAAGGVGVWVIQLARAAGVGEVVGVCGTDNVDFVRKLGATEVIDYRRLNLKDWARGAAKADLVIDCVGGKSLEQSWYCIKNGGTLLSITGIPGESRPEDCMAENVKNLFFIMEPKGEQLGVVRKLLDQGLCKPVVDSIWNLDEYEKAFNKLATGHARGKVIIKITDEPISNLYPVTDSTS